MARRKTPRARTLADELALFNAAAEWPLATFVRLKLGHGKNWAYRHLDGPVPGQRPSETDRDATLTVANGVRVPVYRDYNGRWRVARHQYEAAVARHAESVAS